MPAGRFRRYKHLLLATRAGLGMQFSTRNRIIMNTMTTRLARIAFVLLAASLFSGCVSYERTYPGRTQQQVWTAMISVAEQPNYDSEEWGKWHVMTNNVWVDESGARIEVSRHLRRSVYNAGMVKPDQQERTYELTFSLRGSTEPTVRCSMRGFEIPAEAFTESQRYFDDVGELLMGMPMPMASHAAPEMEEAPADEAESAPVDIDDMN